MVRVAYIEVFRGLSKVNVCRGELVDYDDQTIHVRNKYHCMYALPRALLLSIEKLDKPW